MTRPELQESLQEIQDEIDDLERAVSKRDAQIVELREQNITLRTERLTAEAGLTRREGELQKKIAEVLNEKSELETRVNTAWRIICEPIPSIGQVFRISMALGHGIGASGLTPDTGDQLARSEEKIRELTTALTEAKSSGARNAAIWREKCAETQEKLEKLTSESLKSYAERESTIDRQDAAIRSHQKRVSALEKRLQELAPLEIYEAQIKSVSALVAKLEDTLWVRGEMTLSLSDMLNDLQEALGLPSRDSKAKEKEDQDNFHASCDYGHYGY